MDRRALLGEDAAGGVRVVDATPRELKEDVSLVQYLRAPIGKKTTSRRLDVEDGPHLLHAHCQTVCGSSNPIARERARLADKCYITLDDQCH